MKKCLTFTALALGILSSKHGHTGDAYWHYSKSDGLSSTKIHITVDGNVVGSGTQVDSLFNSNTVISCQDAHGNGRIFFPESTLTPHFGKYEAPYWHLEGNLILAESAPGFGNPEKATCLIESPEEAFPYYVTLLPDQSAVWGHAHKYEDF